MKMTTISPRALDTGEICRFCLAEDVKFVSIFKEDEQREEDERVASRIMSIIPVEVHEGDGLPELACERCLTMLDQAVRFRDEVERSDAVLRHNYGRLWPETNPQLQKLLKEDQVVKKNVNAEFAGDKIEPTEAACVVTLKHEQDDGSQSPVYEEEYDEPQNYTMDDDDDDGSRDEPEDLTERPSMVTPPFGYLDINNLKNMFQEQQEPISLALRETQNTNASKIQPSPLTIPNISVSLIRKNNIAREAQAQAQAQANAQGKARRWRKTNEPCTICGKCFKDRFAMKVHLRTHSGEKPFVCMVCGKAFRQKAHLGKHSYTHSAQRKQQHQQASSHQNQPSSPSNQQAATQQNQQVSPTNLAKIPLQPPVTNGLNAADVKAKLARLSTIIQAKPAKTDPHPISIPTPALPLLQKQPSLGETVSPPHSSPPLQHDSPSSPSDNYQTEPLALVPKTLSSPIIPKVSQPLLLPKPMLTVPQIAPKPAHVPNPSASAVAFYVMANGLLPQNVVVGNGSGLKKS